MLISGLETPNLVMKKQICYLSAALFVLACTPSKPKNENASTEPRTRIQRLDSAINVLIPKEAEVEILASGFTWAEGPVWMPSENALVFTDVPENTAYKWSEGDSISIYLRPSGYTGEKSGKEGANGLILDLKGNLLLCQHGDRRIVRMQASLDDPDEIYESLADQYNGKKFNSPNDLTITSRGTIFFTDPPYGLQEDDIRELDFSGVYKVDTTGTVQLLIDSLTRPNGIALSPDEKTLYVAVSDPQAARYYAYELDENENISSGKMLLDVTSLVSDERKGLPDGLRVDKKGNLFATGPGGVLVISPEGKHLGTILTGQGTANCTFNEDQSELYITAHMHLMRVRLNIQDIK